MIRENKQLVSMRLESSQLDQVQALASRLCIRESDLYQLAVSFTLNKLQCLTDERYSGRDLLPLLLDIREDMNKSLKISKYILFKIVNTPPNKFVEMTDIELLLTPKKDIKAYLQRLGEVTAEDEDSEDCLRRYILNKYNLANKNNIS